jgi:hypothetical protein
MEEPKEAPKFNPTDTQIEVSKKTIFSAADSFFI